MSKHLEVLQRVSLSSDPEDVAHSYAAVAIHTRTVNERASRSNIERVTKEETLRLVQNIFLTAGANPPRVAMFSGIDSGNGCSHVCSQAAAVLAGSVVGSVCLVDANLRTPALPEIFGVTNHHGLADSLRSTGAIRNFTKQLGPANLWLLSCGLLSADSSALINSEVMKARIAELRTEFDYVLIDSPPLNTYSDGVIVGQLADGVVLVLEANSTRREATLKVAENLRAAHIKILGAVLNKRIFAIPEALYRRL
jgi:capsular exopolysaccharide synthesis family protein